MVDVSARSVSFPKVTIRGIMESFNLDKILPLLFLETKPSSFDVQFESDSARQPHLRTLNEATHYQDTLE